MRFLDKLERKLGRFAVQHLTLYLVMGQAFFFMAIVIAKLITYDKVVLIGQLVFQGQIWRLFSFLFAPPLLNPLFAFFALYFFYLMGTGLESHWGAFKFNIYILIGYLMAVAVSLLLPLYPSTNTYIGLSVFLAFAYLYPNFEILIFFILPVKIKYLAYITWIIQIYSFITGALLTKALILVSLANFFLFFASDIRSRLRSYGWRGRRAISAKIQKNQPLHTCSVCGRTDQSHKELEFRYCTDCVPTRCYCLEHLKNHTHVHEGVQEKSET